MKVIGGIIAGLLILFGLGGLDSGRSHISIVYGWVPLIIGGLMIYHLFRERTWNGFLEPVAQFCGIVLVLKGGQQAYHMVSGSWSLGFARAIFFVAYAIVPACGGFLLLYLTSKKGDAESSGSGSK